MISIIMGWDLCVYFDIDQNAIDAFITDNNLDRTKYEDYQTIKKYCITTFMPDLADICSVYYTWNEKLNIHKWSGSTGVNFIRNDERFWDKYYQKMFEKEHNVEFPECLNNILFRINNASDAEEIAENLEKYFADDYKLMHFAGWLKKTAKYSLYYDLSM